MKSSRIVQGGSSARAWVLTAASVVVLATALMTTGAAADGTPTLASDAADYAPGTTATLNGTNWNPNEAIQLVVRGSDGIVYTNRGLEADAGGAFESRFALPTAYVESFTAEATGSSGASATTTFTDSNVRLTPSSLTSSVAAGATSEVTVTATKLATGPAGNPSLNALSTPSGNPNSCSGTTTDIASWLTVVSPALPATITGSSLNITVRVAPPSGQAAGTYRTKLSFTSSNGNADEIHLCVTVTADTTGPTVQCTVPNQSAWYSNDVSVPCTATDSGSGLANAGDASFSLTTSVAAGTETANTQTGSRQVCDSASPQNCVTAGPYTFKVDKKAPAQTGCDSPDVNWHGADVTLNCHYSDGGSGPATQDVSLSTNVSAGTETDNATASAGGAQACDAVSNCAASPSDISGNKVDKKAPSVSCDAADGNWHAGDVSIPCTASDGGSGLANAADGSFSLSTNVAAGTETANASTGSRSIADAVGNSATAGPISGNKVDKKAPQLSSCDAGDGDWHGADVTLNCHYSDGGSGPATQDVSLSTNVSAGTETDNATASAGGAQACDAVSNCAASPSDISGNKVDKKAPSVSCDAADGNWHAGDVSIPCTASDGGSGLANAADGSFSLSTNVAAGTETANASTGSRSIADAVGNSATAGPISGNKVDKKAPVVTLSCPAQVILGSIATAGWSATDGGSGVKLGFASGSIGLDASSIGGKTATVSAAASRDNVLNESTAVSCSYSVVYDFHGFFQPVDNLPTMNRVTAGSAVPVKFDLGGDQGLNIFAAGFPKTKMISCSDASALDDIESTVTAGGSSLSYGNGQYVYVWKTEKTWAGQCRQLDLVLIDGTVHSAKFRFK